MGKSPIANNENIKFCLDGKAFYGTRISENLSRTPEGFLVCRNVPISKVGTQDYLGSELGIKEYPNKIFTVIREESEVFNPASIASFEGKPFTDEHPDNGVNSDNYAKYLKGHVTNVRRGEGEDSDKLIADLVIYDKPTQDKIESGKREISCGYNCNFAEYEDGKIYQRKIRGNHVSLVDDGRAGDDVSIKDQNSTVSTSNHEVNIKNKQGVNHTMSKETKKQNLIGRIITAFSKDAEPEDVAEAVGLLSDNAEEKTETDENTAEVKTDNNLPETKDNPLSAVLEAIEKLSGEVAALKAGQNKDDDPLEKLEKAIENSDEEAADEEDVTKSADEVDEDGVIDEEADTSDSEETKTAADKNAVLELIRAIKPIVANIKDDNQKKLVTDSMTKLVSPYLKPTSKANGYDMILKAKQAAASRNIKDSKAVNVKEESDGKELGQTIAASRNPHYKKNT